MPVYLEQNEWKLIRVNGEFRAVSIDENQRLLTFHSRYKGYKDVPDEETFNSFDLVENESGILYCEGTGIKSHYINKLEWFLLPKKL